MQFFAKPATAVGTNKDFGQLSLLVFQTSQDLAVISMAESNYGI